jgi:cytochrome c oxidase subunit III
VASTPSAPVRESDLNSLSTLTAVVVLATVTMTFGAMIAVFVIRSQVSAFWGRLELPKVLWLTTAALLASSFTLEAARKSLAQNQQAKAFRMLAWTTGLGFFFLLGQAGAWMQVLHSGINLQNNPHSWFIFLFTGLHGLHIVLGLGGLTYLLVRTREEVSGPRYQMTTRVVTRGVSLFWHYLDFLWLVLFGLLLLWRR